MDDISLPSNIEDLATGERASGSNIHSSKVDAFALFNNKSDENPTIDPPSNFDNIEAFKTITMMLDVLQLRRNPIDIRDNLKKGTKGPAIKDSSDRQEIRTLCAFAQLAAGEHDIAALATNRISTDGSELRIISCVNPLLKDPSLTTTSKNKEDRVSLPEIHKASRPECAEGLTGLEYMGIIIKRWKRPTSSEHLWILSNALISPNGQHDPKFLSDLIPNLSKYTIAIYYKNIARWFGDKCLSLPFRNALEKVMPTDIPMLQSTVKPPHRLSYEEVNDMDFLSGFVFHYAKRLEDPRLIELTTEFPKLIEMAVDARGKSPEYSCEVYTNETRIEFHSLLLELLGLLDAALKALTDMDEETANSTNEGAEQFYSNVRRVDIIGYALQRIATGRAFGKHMQNIETLLLPNDPRKNVRAVSTEHSKAFLMHHWVVRTSGSESESKTTMLLPESYVNWLQLMLRYINAVEVLSGYVTSHHFTFKSISLSTLAVPKTTNTFLPWTRLFSDNTFISPEKGATPSNEDILEFLDVGSKTDKEADELLSQLRSSLTVDDLKKLTGITYLNIGRNARRILAKIDESTPFSDDIRAEVVALCNVLVELPPREQFFRNLNKMMAFEGTAHCEMNLATLLPAFTEQMTSEERKSYYKNINILSDMQGFGHVIGVSEPSCPSCAIFLEKLASISGSPSAFAIRGNHGTISGCSLPPWTPDRFVAAMNARLGSILRQGLIALMQEDSYSRKIKLLELAFRYRRTDLWTPT
ncbi:hypothetical protein BDN70DRAFT_871529 [Pholiota conissans]|uniref:Uncharacterized protein n=1 Tax=Pholiota conissans TaxID=109636 RepID=A0A9P6CYD7_9AGAR|nr:hypothetical protein BDN70DRAFT_871529 [Pholiota conissans]